MIQKILELSINHVTAEDIRLLQDEESFSVGDYEYGLFLFVPQTEDSIKSKAIMYSTSFIKILKYAARQKCAYVVLDCGIDIEEGPDFDIHEW